MGTALGGAIALPAAALAAGQFGRIGLELYAVRAAIRADPERTLAAIGAIGYTDVELLWSFGNFGRTPQQVRTTLDGEGLKAPSAHIAAETLLQNWAKSLETANLLGHQFLFVPSLPAETNHSLDAWRRWADRFNDAGASARRAGIWLGFHNEPNHMTPLDGKVRSSTEGRGSSRGERSSPGHRYACEDHRQNEIAATQSASRSRSIAAVRRCRSLDSRLNCAVPRLVSE